MERVRPGNPPYLRRVRARDHRRDGSGSELWGYPRACLAVLGVGVKGPDATPTFFFLHRCLTQASIRAITLILGRGEGGTPMLPCDPHRVAGGCPPPSASLLGDTPYLPSSERGGGEGANLPFPPPPSVVLRPRRGPALPGPAPGESRSSRAAPGAAGGRRGKQEAAWGGGGKKKKSARLGSARLPPPLCPWRSAAPAGRRGPRVSERCAPPRVASSGGVGVGVCHCGVVGRGTCTHTQRSRWG